MKEKEQAPQGIFGKIDSVTEKGGELHDEHRPAADLRHRVRQRGG